MLLLGPQGEKSAEREVVCEGPEVWKYAAVFADAGRPADRLHIIDSQGEIVAIVGLRSAKASRVVQAAG